MDTTLALEIARHAYASDPAGLDATMQQLGQPGWPRVLHNLQFDALSTGGGCMMLIADLPGTAGCQVGITDGEAGLPADPETFWLGILNGDGEELYTLQVHRGHLA